MAWYFHRVTTLSLPANALVIPLAGILMPTAVLAVALIVCFVLAGASPALIAGYSLGLLTGNGPPHRAFRYRRRAASDTTLAMLLARSCRLWAAH